MAPPGLEIALYSQLAELPHFNPDLDIEPAPLPVLHFRAACARSQAVVISTPEYAHGVPGTLKNALDWVVRSGELYEKPIILINPSARSANAQAALTEILKTMGARIITEACVTLQPSGPLSSAEILAATHLSTPLRASIDTVLRSVESKEIALP
jgi:chromate reductase